jgi:type II secretory pathway pseudopilin PulG
MRIRPAQSLQGFTMVEIAICLAVIGFALVAIIGVLPLGIQVQSDNRQEAIINHDGAYFLDAIRKGAPAEDLSNYVEEISITYSNGVNLVTNTANVFRDNHQIIGMLSYPHAVKTEAIVRALSGAASEKGEYNNDLAFKYRMTAIIRPLNSLNPELVLEPEGAKPPYTLYDWQSSRGDTNLIHDVRLMFRYPLTFSGKTGTGRKVFRAMVSGRMNQHPTNEFEHYFYRPGLSATNLLATNNIYAL